MIRRPPRSTLFPTRRSSDLIGPCGRRCSTRHGGRFVDRLLCYAEQSVDEADRKSTRLNSSHDQISYAVFCLKKKKPRYLEFRQRQIQRVEIAIPLGASILTT